MGVTGLDSIVGGRGADACHGAATERQCEVEVIAEVLVQGCLGLTLSLLLVVILTERVAG